MKADEQRQIEQACWDLVTRLVHYSDRHLKKESSELFTIDGTWIRGGTPFTGREAIVNSFTLPPTEVLRHFATSTMIDVEDERTARGVTYYLLYRYDPQSEEPKLPLPLRQPFAIGEWHDRFVKTDEGWRFAHREVRRLFQSA
jgi:hypothetical protein